MEITISGKSNIRSIKPYTVVQSSNKNKNKAASTNTIKVIMKVNSLVRCFINCVFVSN